MDMSTTFETETKACRGNELGKLRDSNPKIVLYNDIGNVTIYLVNLNKSISLEIVVYTEQMFTQIQLIRIYATH